MFWSLELRLASLSLKEPVSAEIENVALAPRFAVVLRDSVLYPPQAYWLLVRPDPLFEDVLHVALAVTGGSTCSN